MINLETYKRACAKFSGERAHALRCLTEETACKADCLEALADAQKAREIIQHAAQVTQQLVHDGVATIVTECLRSVFGEESYKFEIKFVRARNKTEARLVLSREGHELDPLDSSGGGVIDVVSMALRLACLMLAKPALRKLLVLDEPFRCLSKSYRPVAAQLIQKLAQETEIQFIICSHDEEFQVGKVIEIGEEE